MKPLLLALAFSVPALPSAKAADPSLWGMPSSMPMMLTGQFPGGVPSGITSTLNCDRPSAKRITIRTPADAPAVYAYGPINVITICVMPGYTITTEPAR